MCPLRYRLPPTAGSHDNGRRDARRNRYRKPQPDASPGSSKQSAASAAGTRSPKGSGDDPERAGHAANRARLARGRDRLGGRGGSGGHDRTRRRTHGITGDQRRLARDGGERRRTSVAAASPATAANAASLTATATDAAPAAQSVSPAGWAPVPYGNAQLSVPGSSWLVEAPQQLMCGLGGLRRDDLRGRHPRVPQGLELRRDRQPGLDPPGREVPEGTHPGQAQRRHSRHPGLPAGQRQGHHGVPRAGTRGARRRQRQAGRAGAGHAVQVAARRRAQRWSGRPRPGRLDLAAVRRRDVRDPALLGPAARRPVVHLRNRPVDERAAAGRRDQAADVPAVPAPAPVRRR